MFFSLFVLRSCCSSGSHRSSLLFLVSAFFVLSFLLFSFSLGLYFCSVFFCFLASCFFPVLTSFSSSRLCQRRLPLRRSARHHGHLAPEPRRLCRLADRRFGRMLSRRLSSADSAAQEEIQSAGRDSGARKAVPGGRRCHCNCSGRRRPLSWQFSGHLVVLARRAVHASEFRAGACCAHVCLSLGAGSCRVFVSR